MAKLKSWKDDFDLEMILKKTQEDFKNEKAEKRDIPFSQHA